MKTMSVWVSRTALATALTVAPGAALAQAPAIEQPAVSAEGARFSGDIVVTANRREQRLQDVAATITAVTSEQIQNLKLFRVEDVAVLSPGLQLDKGANGYRASASLRGIAYDSSAGGTPTVDFYLNDVVIDPNNALNAMFDIGQIEVLRGPQGTLRGRPTPSGAITIRSARPNAEEWGGLAQATVATRDSLNLQGAVNVPLIPEKLAVRVAGLIDRTRGDNVRSVNSSTKPYTRTDAARISILATPTENLDILLTYQHVEARYRSFQPVTGPGAGYNGPALTSKDRRAVGDSAELANQNNEFASLEATLHLPIDADLKYVGGYTNTKTVARNTLDDGNSILNYEPIQRLTIPVEIWSHEVRLQSTSAGFLDYVLGGYYVTTKSFTTISQPIVFGGAFGPLGSRSGTLNPAYVLDYRQQIDSHPNTKAVFANLTAHVTDRLEVTAGARYNRFTNKGQFTNVEAGSARLTIAPNPTPFPDAFVCGAFIPGLSIPSLNPGNCDIPITIPALRTFRRNTIDQPITYNASVKYEVTPNVNAYASFGHSWRAGSGTVGLQFHNNPILIGYQNGSPETSNSYEVGIKSSLLDRRLQLSAAVYQQDFKGFINVFPSIPYLGNSKIETIAFISNVDARVRGFELDASFRATPEWDISLTAAYAKSKISNSAVPCRDGNGDGRPDSLPVGSGVVGKGGEPGATNPAGNLTEARPVATCASNSSLSGAPNFSTTIQTEYRIPLGENEAYLRALGAFRGKAQDPTTLFAVDKYFLLDLFAGIRIGDGADIGLFARNVLNQQTEIARNNFAVPSPVADPALPSTGYFTTQQTRQRQFGASVNYRW